VVPRADERLIRDVRVRAIATPVGADWGWERIDTAGAWAVAPSKGRGAIVAVVDTGVDAEHPDLARAMWTNPGEVPGNGLDDDENGYVDDVHGYNIVDQSGDISDPYGHGTHVAGIIAAANNGAGTVGVAPNAKIMAVRVLGDDGGGNLSDVVDGILWAIEQGAQIINLSIGGDLDEETLRALEPVADAARAAGVLIVGAAGNDGANDSIIGFPAGMTGVVGVGSSDDDRAGGGPVSSYSSRHAGVDLIAPGYSVLSTIPGGGYTFASGSSMATPHVAAVAALIRSVRPKATPAAIAALITATAERWPRIAVGGRDAMVEQLGDGVIDAAGAVRAAIANVGVVSLSGRVIDPTNPLSIVPIRPSGATPTRCTIAVRSRRHVGVPDSPVARRVVRARSCDPLTLTDAWIAARFPALSGVGEEPADLELVATVDGTTHVHRIAVVRPDTLAPTLTGDTPALGSAGLLTRAVDLPVLFRGSLPDAVAAYDLRIRLTGESDWRDVGRMEVDGRADYRQTRRDAGIADLALVLAEGATIEVSGRATDTAGNSGPWSTPVRSLVPGRLDPVLLEGSRGMTFESRAGALGDGVLVSEPTATLPRLRLSGFRGNLLAFSGTYSSTAPVCYTVTVSWRDRGSARARTKERCTDADWEGKPKVHDATGVAYADGETGVLLFYWEIPQRRYDRIEIAVRSMGAGARFEVDAVATRRP
jgi:hypothetical protein